MSNPRHLGFTIAGLSLAAGAYFLLSQAPPLSWTLAVVFGTLAGYAIVAAGHPARNAIVHLKGLTWTREDFCRGWLITGDTGSGKTRSGITPLLYQVFQNEPHWGGLCIDDKGIRLIALHHLDAPWRPADVEQREGRILRQGNRNAEVQIYRYVTEGSFDAYMWQTLETKAKFIHQVMTGRNDLRHIEDIDGAALTYAEAKAIASGNPLVIEKAHIDAELGRLSRLRAQYHETQYRIRNTIRRTHEEVEILTSRIENLHKDIAARQPTQGDAFKVRVEGTEYTDRAIAGELINRRAQQLRGSGKDYKIGDQCDGRCTTVTG